MVYLGENKITVPKNQRCGTILRIHAWSVQLFPNWKFFSTVVRQKLSQRINHQRGCRLPRSWSKWSLEPPFHTIIFWCEDLWSVNQNVEKTVRSPQKARKMNYHYQERILDVERSSILQIIWTAGTTSSATKKRVTSRGEYEWKKIGICHMTGGRAASVFTWVDDLKKDLTNFQRRYFRGFSPKLSREICRG